MPHHCLIISPNKMWHCFKSVPCSHTIHPSLVPIGANGWWCSRGIQRIQLKVSQRVPSRNYPSLPQHPHHVWLWRRNSHGPSSGRGSQLVPKLGYFLTYLLPHVGEHPIHPPPLLVTSNSPTHPLPSHLGSGLLGFNAPLSFTQLGFIVRPIMSKQTALTFLSPPPPIV